MPSHRARRARGRLARRSLGVSATAVWSGQPRLQFPLHLVELLVEVGFSTCVHGAGARGPRPRGELRPTWARQGNEGEGEDEGEEEDEEEDGEDEGGEDGAKSSNEEEGEGGCDEDDGAETEEDAARMIATAARLRRGR